MDTYLSRRNAVAIIGTTSILFFIFLSTYHYLEYGASDDQVLMLRHLTEFLSNEASPESKINLMKDEKEGQTKELFTANNHANKIPSSTSLTRSQRMLSTKKAVFYAIGDAPYRRSEYRLLREQLEDLHDDYEDDEAAFIIHVGDIMKFKTAFCGSSYYKSVRSLFTQYAPITMFTTPGDNDWFDCDDPNDGIKLWRSYFNHFEDNWDHDYLNVMHQNEREENFAFIHAGVLFISMNLVTGMDHGDDLSEEVMAQNVEWFESNLKKYADSIHAVVMLSHARRRDPLEDFWNPVMDLIRDSDYRSMPFLYVHGDGHYYKARTVKDNLVDVQVDRGGRAPPLKITIEDGSVSIDDKFVFDRRGGRDFYRLRNRRERRQRRERRH